MNLEIGIASYRNPGKLKRTLETIHANTVQPHTVHVWHNRSDDPENDAALKILDGVYEHTVSNNVGYAGAVNGLLHASSAPYFLYCDNDIEVRTRGWDERLMEVLVENPEVAQVFPGAGHYGFHNGRYHECLWNAGYCWMLRRSALDELAPGLGLETKRLLQMFMDELNGKDCRTHVMDTGLGHHEEVDLMIRLRLAGFQIACVPGVDVLHHETATKSSDALHQPGGRIHDGVVRWMNKWNRYFCGDALKYSMTEYDQRALRYTDWPPCALYLERWTLAQFPDWNKHSRETENVEHGFREVATKAGIMDAVEILKPKGPYRGRAI